MQAKEAVEIDDRLGSVARTWNGDARAHSVIRLLAMRHHDVQPIGRTTLKEHNKTFIARAGSRFRRINCARKKAGNNTGSNKSQRAILQKNSASYGHRLPSTKQIQPSDSDERSVIPRTVDRASVVIACKQIRGTLCCLPETLAAHSPSLKLRRPNNQSSNGAEIGRPVRVIKFPLRHLRIFQLLEHDRMRLRRYVAGKNIFLQQAQGFLAVPRRSAVQQCLLIQ